MQRQVLMPALSPSMTDGRIARWHVSEGQSVAAGDILAEIVTATATLELEAKNEGRVEKILVPAGATAVKINTPIALIHAEDTAPAPAQSSAVEPPGTRKSRPVRPAGAGLSQKSEYAVQPAGGVQHLSYREALRDALAEEMRRDPDVFLIGADVAQNRGAQKVTQGLLDEFGPSRVVSTPALVECFTGLAIGAALSGLRPVVELASWSGALEAFQAIVTAAAQTHFLSGGTVTVPIVFRGPDGWVPGAAGEQSLCCAALFAHVPGLKVVAPATPADAKGLLKAAIRDPGPVLVLEHERLYDSAGPVPLADLATPIGTAHIARPGRDVSIVTFGRALLTALDAAELLETHGVSAEVLDLRTLRPLHVEAVTASVLKTRRLVTVEEGWPQGGIGAEIAALVGIAAFAQLAAPPQRVAGADLPMPYAFSLEQLAVPGAKRIAEAALTAFRWPPST
jgi:pyruvate dehydrogenase E1 component beta subunit